MRVSISRTSWLSQARAISSALATGGSGIADDADELVDVGQRHRQAFEHMAALARLAQARTRCGASPPRGGAAMKTSTKSFRLHSLGWPSTSATMFMPKVSCSCVCLYRLLSTTSGTSPRLSSITRRMPDLSGLVLDVADAFDLFSLHQLGHALLQRLLVHLVGQLIDDDGLALAAVDVLEVHLGAHHHAPAPGAVAVATPWMP